MKTQHFLTASMLLLVAWLLPLRCVQADTVIFDSAGFIEGSQSFTTSFDITTPGTLTVSLADVPWLDTLSNLNVFLSSTTGLVAPSMAAGSETMQVEPGRMFAHWFGAANGQYNVGVYSLQIDFQPSTVPVPLPKGLILLLSGFGLILILQPRRGSEPQSIIPSLGADNPVTNAGGL